MSNYKIRVNNESESKEAQVLFFELGGSIDSCDRFGMVCLSDGRVYTDRVEFFEEYDDCEEITLHQLRDLVAQSKNEQGLISGADALRALADGKDVEYWCENDPSIQKRWTPIRALNEYRLSYFLEDKPRFEFRLKPRTITLNVEIPAPFEPKEGDVYWHISPVNECGYKSKTYQEEFNSTQFGAWRTEDEIKQVVAALRGALK